MAEIEKAFLPKTWLGKFGCAFRGVRVGIGAYGAASFAVHLPVMAGVLAFAVWDGVTWPEWYLLIVCITIVLAAEMFNSSIEALAKAVTKEYDPHIRDALDIASGAVFTAVIGAATVGVLILVG
ncbi:diacylglycerol kinase [Botrimarina mediterranea]|uniref:Prokaryotic diacylglycerol kinase n=1 Tax=Botrimarina mediterranea TaxID=2528022 RepID=A0A518KE84_9BACT|nr:diacylglycerol kinase [Botrimarina mediterranea]QDV76100.1 Prokaryotic diacylglycerol kinase [Botrimarina mediterranea]QDV80698.1 Prokaryotic diacylglycerol kinase [Planctomycetes bacterium K2D]